MEETNFKCLRCGHEYMGPFDRKVPIERTCPRCNSNSVRRVKKTSVRKLKNNFKITEK